MSVAGFNALWLLCVFLLLIAFLLAIRRRRLAAKQEETNRNINTTTFIRNTGQEVRIHMTRTMNPNTDPALFNTTAPQPPPPAFDPEEQALPPPSYQEFRKDVRVQPNTSHPL